MKGLMRKSLCAAAAACLLVSTSAWAETIKVGAILAVTGPASFLGGPEARTLEMLVEEVNAKGGINGNKIELIVKDTAGNPEKAISFAKQLIEEEKVSGDHRTVHSAARPWRSRRSSRTPRPC